MTNITQLNDGHWVSIMSEVCFKYQHIKINKTCFVTSRNSGLKEVDNITNIL